MDKTSPSTAPAAQGLARANSTGEACSTQCNACVGLSQPHQDYGLCHTNNEQGLAPKDCLQQQVRMWLPCTGNATASNINACCRGFAMERGICLH